ncbi:MAG: APC family permease [Tissierellales bacterium]|jgi:amino acid transporter|nr:APC family permease [Tissierellales bacterium]
MEKEFKKILGFSSLLAAAVGIVVSQGTLVSVMQGIALGQTDFIIALSIAALLSFCYICTFSELSLMMPKAGGINAYSQVALGHFPSIVATLCGYVVVSVLGIPAELQLLQSGIFEVFHVNIPHLGLVLLIIVTAMNIFGIDFFSKFQNVFSFSMIAVLALIGIQYFTGTSPESNDLNSLSMSSISISNAFSLVSLALWAFLGAEFICSLSEESINPQKHIPRAMTIGMIIIFVLYTLFGLTAIKFLPQDIILSSQMPHFKLINEILGSFGSSIMLIVCISASSSTINSIMSSIPRMMYGMSKSGQLPSFIGYIHPKFKTPVFAILSLFLLALIPMIGMTSSIEQVITLLIAASTSWLATYVIAHFSLIKLRKDYPHHTRPYKSPLFPMPQLFGSLGMIYVFFNCAPTPELAPTIYKYAGICISIVAIYAIIWIKFVMKTSLFTPVQMSKILDEVA